MPQQVIVGFDGTSASRSALRQALKRAGPEDAIVVVHAYPKVSEIMGRPFYDHAVMKRQHEARRVLDKAREVVADAPVQVTYDMLEGPAADVLSRVADVRDANAIVVGTRRLGRVNGALHSVSQKLLRHAERPVIAVPADGPTV